VGTYPQNGCASSDADHSAPADRMAQTASSPEFSLIIRHTVLHQQPLCCPSLALSVVNRQPSGTFYAIRDNRFRNWLRL